MRDTELRNKIDMVQEPRAQYAHIRQAECIARKQHDTAPTCSSTWNNIITELFDVLFCFFWFYFVSLSFVSIFSFSFFFVNLFLFFRSFVWHRKNVWMEETQHAFIYIDNEWMLRCCPLSSSYCNSCIQARVCFCVRLTTLSTSLQLMLATCRYALHISIGNAFTCHRRKLSTKLSQSCSLRLALPLGWCEEDEEKKRENIVTDNDDNDDNDKVETASKSATQ